jgi:SAM-dependent methyltransferase
MLTDANADQMTFWNSVAGPTWVAREADLDFLHRSVVDILLDAAAPSPGAAILDIGCGSGATSLAFAEAVGSSGEVLGIDISEPLLARAEARRHAAGLENLGFFNADAQTAALPPARFDAAISRFGVMFFADPVVAFRNIASALKPGAGVAFAAWSDAERNPWFSESLRIAAGRLGPLPTPPPGAPGPTAFADRDRVVSLLEAAGLADASAETLPIELHHPGGIDAIAGLSAEVGPTPRAMRERNGTPEDLAAIVAGVAETFATYATPDGIRIPAEIHLFRAHRP